MTTLFGVAGFLVYERINGTARRLAVMPMRNSIILGGNFYRSLYAGHSADDLDGGFWRAGVERAVRQ